MQSGKIGVTTENIFPIIKKFLYSDHEIFLRELISNAVDATQKLKTLSSIGEFKGELGDIAITLTLDSENKQLTISDNGIGMTAEEIDKYINQIAFSGAEEFMKKYNDQSIIGHFGLGFYSAFMVASKVEIRTQSFKEGAKTMLWSCSGDPEYTLTESAESRSRGTDIILHFAEDSIEFNDKAKIEQLLKKYCSFLPVAINFDGKQINDTNPLWCRKPSDITLEEYNKFYQKLYPMSEDPLFHIHLNIDYPFNLTGILYFPKIKNNFELQKNKIQLYSNQVFVTDSVEGIVPEFLTLLHGVIDSPDIPLNVSRSYLQSDSNVKKISSYITRKVSDRLKELFTSSREDFQGKWDALKIFIEYGIISEEKFAEKATEFFLFKNVDDKFFTLSEYKELITANQTDKNNTLIYLYANNIVDNHSFIESAKAKGYDVLVMETPLDGHFINWFESKNENCRFVRVDSDVVDRLIVKDSSATISLTSGQVDVMRTIFASQLPKQEGVNYNVALEPMNESDSPVVITRNEYMRRMKDMAAVSGGADPMSRFYAQMPDDYTIAVNGNHPLVISILEKAEKDGGETLTKLTDRLHKVEGEQNALQELISKKKEEEISQEERDKRDELSNDIAKINTERNDALAKIAENTPLVKQLIDLALLSNNMLRGEALTTFIKRSVDLIKS